MNVHFLDPAKEELKEAVAYYDRKRTSLGDAFAADLAETIEKILMAPGAGSLLAPSVRRRRTSRFPYGVVYTVRGEELIIIAVMHLHRKPGYWQGRL
jgi:plasmid stabilization system protein ParE